METNYDINTKQDNQIESKKDFWNGGWGYLVFFVLLIGGLIALSYIIKGIL